MKPVIKRWMQRIFPGYDEHLSDERLEALICDDLSMVERWTARRHVARCSSCRALREVMEGPVAQRILDVYRKGTEEANPFLSERPSIAFERWLELQTRHSILSKSIYGIAPRRSSLLPNLRLPRLSSAIPALAAGAAFALVAAALLSYWRQQRTPNLTANTLLVRAESWDAVSSATPSGVIHQTVRIKLPDRVMDRSLYRDVQGVRHLQRVALAHTEDQIEAELDKAGVDWDQPISASGYRAWHDSQRERTDRIVRKSHLLTLTTDVPDGPVSEESLTVRDSDFHPVRRTINLRSDRGHADETIEIAELDFAVLPWSAVNASIFEPSTEVALSMPPAARVLPSLPSLQTPSAEALDEAELSARLVLNRLHADAGEQIEVHRLAQQIEVSGLVETEERKRQLITQLAMMPWVRVSIQSLAHLADSPASGTETIRLEEATLPDQPSALDAYLRARGRGVDESSLLARRLFNCASAISRESSIIADLDRRFVDTERLSLIASVTLGSLRYSHHERLETALREQRAVLAQVVGRVSVHSAARPIANASLGESAARNLALAKELTETDRPPARSAEAILTDIFTAEDTIAAAGYQKNGTPTQDHARNPER